ncbi:glycosyltransferase [Streptomyces sp. NPDC090442]|uniref:glycosyltransferase n=1 Tax=Streptomyces sp. NPDC090442 TaxID=3365962 RepID=UPI00382FEB9E
MKILLISDVDVESGRGPVTRLASVLPELSRRAEVVVGMLGEADETCRRAVETSQVRAHPLPFAMRGWNVVDLPGLVGRIEGLVRHERPDLVVLYREIWDLMHALPPVLARAGVPFLVMPHSVPFLDAMARPTRSFAWDLCRRVATERRGHALRYLLTHVHQVRLLRTLPRVMINQTVSVYLHGYFPQAPTVHALPGYAVDLDAIRSAADVEKTYDVAFMAKLTAGKGLFHLLDVMRRLRRLRPEARMIVIGSFENAAVERKFLAARDRYGLRDAIHLAGWLTGEEKYRALGSARTFCYPSISADTFSLCLLEALAGGLPAVCYDVPFTRAVYGTTPAVRRVPFASRSLMAGELHTLLAAHTLESASTAATEFATGYSSWGAVADAELAAYGNFLGLVGAEPRAETEHR